MSMGSDNGLKAQAFPEARRVAQFGAAAVLLPCLTGSGCDPRLRPAASRPWLERTAV